MTTLADRTMRAVLQHRYGTAEVLRLGRVPRPVIGEHDVLVEVVRCELHLRPPGQAAGLDPAVAGDPGDPPHVAVQHAGAVAGVELTGVVAGLDHITDVQWVAVLVGVEDPLAEELLKGEFAGKDIVRVEVKKVGDKKQLVFEGRSSKEQPQPEPEPVGAGAGADGGGS